MTLSQAFRAEKAKVFRAFGVVAVISLLASLCLLAMPLYLVQIYDRVLFAHSIETLISLTLVAVLVIVTYSVLDALRSNILARLAVSLEARMSGPIIAAELLRSNDTQRSTQLLLQNVARVVGSGIVPAFFELPGTIIFLAIIFMIHPVLGTVVLVAIGILTGIAVLGEFITSGNAQSAQESSALARRQLEATYRQQEAIKGMGMFREAIAAWAVNQAETLRANLRAEETSNIITAISRGGRQLIQIAIIGMGAVVVMSGGLAAGVIFATSVVAGRALQPIEQIAGGWRLFKTGLLSLRALEERLEKLELPDALTPLPRPKGRINIEQVVYVSSSGDPLLRGVTAQIPPAGAVAIVGPSGAGKSTLARCIVGYLKPTRGHIALDGQDVQSWDPVVKGLYMGYLPQTVEFFEGTVAENIARLRQGDPAEFVIQAAELAGVHELIMSFPQGYDTILSAQGFMPSGGQRQLLGLARAFYGNPAVVVLDEPNANLDGDGEEILNEAIVRAKQNGTTVIVVTQRLALLQFVDKVLVMKNGQIEQMSEPSAIRGGNVRSINKSAPPPDRAAGSEGRK